MTTICFQADHRTNGLTHVTVTHEGQEAGGFTLPTQVFHAVSQGLQTTGPVQESEHGEPIARTAAPKKRTRRTKSEQLATIPPAE